MKEKDGDRGGWGVGREKEKRKKWGLFDLK